MNAMLNFFRKMKHDIGIDLGTSNTQVYTKEKGIVINEPTVVTINIKSNQIVAVGHEAKQMLGKTPKHIDVTRPLTNGVISDYEVAEKLLKYFLDKVTDKSSGLRGRPRVVTCIPLQSTEVELKAVEDAAVAGGARQVNVVHGAIAAALGARMPIQEPIGNMVVDIGGGKTEVAVIALSGVVNWKSTKVAGDEMNRNIVQYAREVFNLLIGEKYAEQVKIKVGSAKPLEDVLEFPMRGRDVLTGLPKEIMINDSHIREALSRSVATIVETIKMTLEVTPPELTADIHERGILLTGGGSLLRGLESIIAEHAEIPVRIADDPKSAVVRGTGVLLDDQELLDQVALPSARA